MAQKDLPVGVKKNLNPGAGTWAWYCAPVGTATPFVADLGPTSLGLASYVTPISGFVHLGYTKDAAEINIANEFEMRTVNEHMGPLGADKISEGATIKMTFAEWFPDNLQYAISGTTVTDTAAAANVTGKTVLTYGDGADGESQEFTLLGIKPLGGTNGGDVGVQFWRVKVLDAVSLPGDKPHQGYDVTFTAFVDSAKSAGSRIFEWTEITTVATS